MLNEDFNVIAADFFSNYTLEEMALLLDIEIEEIVEFLSSHEDAVEILQDHMNYEEDEEYAESDGLDT